MDIKDPHVDSSSKPPGLASTADLVSVFELVRCAAQAVSRQDVDKRMVRMASGLTDWSLVLEMANVHGVTSLVYANLKRVFGSRIPPAVVDAIERYEEGARIRNSFLVQELGRLTARFSDEGIPFIAFKGPVLDQMVYSRPSRQYSDLDVLIKPGQFHRVKRLLRDDGYEVASTLRPLGRVRRSIFRLINRQLEFVRAVGAFQVDLHTRLMPVGYLYGAHTDRLLERSQPVRVGSVRVPALAAEDVLLLLCYHGLKNQWNALKYMVDIAALLRAYPALSWDVVRKRARKYHGSRILKLGLYLAREIADAPLSESIKRWVYEGKTIERVAAALIDHLPHRIQGGTLPKADRIRLQLYAHPTIGGKMRYVSYSVLQHIWSRFFKPIHPGQ